jgi:hypothetical protein
MARRSIDIKRFVSELRGHFVGQLEETQTCEEAVARFDHALSRTLLDAVAGTPAAVASTPAPRRSRSRKRAAAGASAKMPDAPAVGGQAGGQAAATHA